MRRFAPLLLAAVFAAAGVTPRLAWAQDVYEEGDKNDDKDEKKQKKKDGSEEKKPKPKPDYPPLAEMVKKDFEKLEGLITLYHNEKTHQVLAVIPPDKLDEPMYVATTISRGLPFRGLQWSDMLVEWQQVGKKLVLVEPELRYRTDANDPLAAAVQATHVGSILNAAPIVAKDDKGGLAIDLTQFYAQSQQAFLGDLGKILNPQLVQVHEVKDFPENVELSLDIPIAQPPPGWRLEPGQILTVHHSLSALPEKPTYQPREADDRVGYFITAVKNYSKVEPGRDPFVRFVHRWDLEKADPRLKKSSPKDPIVFYVEKTVPVRYRPYVIEGILEWNEAFEKVGLVNAIVVRQQTDSNQFKDLDPEDVRYNFFRWATGDLGFAAGPSRVDPRTGQILDADILFDDTMVRVMLSRYRLMVRDVATSYITPEVRAFLAAHPERSPERLLERQGWGGVDDLPLEPAAQIRALMGPELLQRQGMGLGRTGDAMLWGSGERACNYAVGMRHELAFGGLQLGLFGSARPGQGDAAPDAANDKPKDGEEEDPFPEEFIGAVVKDIVMHEVGHTLGLRHNFKASSWRDVAAINDTAANGATAAQPVASVMDYNPVNVSPRGRPQGHQTMTSIGPYDYWAIEYGYTPRPKTIRPDQEKEKLLDPIAERIAEPGLDFGTDEDLFLTRDPSINVWDLGADSLEFFRQRTELVEQLRGELVARAMDEGESFSHLRKAFDTLLFEQLRNGLMASRYVGGVHFNRDHLGDPNARDPQVLVPHADQRRAVDFIVDSLFREGAFDFSSDLLAKLGGDRWLHWGNYGWIEPVEYPLHDRILGVQRWVLIQLINYATLGALNDAVLKAAPGDEVLTVAELTDELYASIFTELERGPAGRRFTDEEPFVTSVRANLQREYLGWLMFISLEGDYGWYPHTARTLARQQLRRVIDAVETLRHDGGVRLDRASIAHLEDMQNRAQRALEASYEISM